MRTVLFFLFIFSIQSSFAQQFNWNNQVLDKKINDRLNTEKIIIEVYEYDSTSIDSLKKYYSNKLIYFFNENGLIKEELDFSRSFYLYNNIIDTIYTKTTYRYNERGDEIYRMYTYDSIQIDITETVYSYKNNKIEKFISKSWDSNDTTNKIIHIANYKYDNNGNLILTKSSNNIEWDYNSTHDTKHHRSKSHKAWKTSYKYDSKNNLSKSIYKTYYIIEENYKWNEFGQLINSKEQSRQYNRRFKNPITREYNRAYKYDSTGKKLNVFVDYFFINDFLVTKNKIETIKGTSNLFYEYNSIDSLYKEYFYSDIPYTDEKDTLTSTGRITTYEYDENNRIKTIADKDFKRKRERIINYQYFYRKD